MRATLFVAFPLALFAVGCGGTSKTRDPGVAHAGGGARGVEADSGTGGACPEPESSVPDVAPFVPPPLNSLGSFNVTFQNRCVATVWPAWATSSGLDNTVIDTQIWFPMSPGSDRTVTVYGGLRDIALWGRTACSFDTEGLGACQTGDCGGFKCPTLVGSFPANATVFALQMGFLGGYNLAMRVAGVACGKHDCIADLGTCGAASAVLDRCGGTIACRDACSQAAPECCAEARSRCDKEQTDRDTEATDDLVVTFCP